MEKDFNDIDKLQYSPMIRQYLEIKEQYPDTLLLYRVGDFYELFFNDAIVASRVLEIVLTGKDAGVDERVPMCGVPYHAVDSYIDTLAANGFKVGIVEQVEDPKSAKGIVKREVIRIVTPGTVIDANAINASDFNYILSISGDKNRYILSYLDLSTGAGYLTNIPLDDNLLFAEIMKLQAKEIVVSEKFNKEIFTPLLKVYNFLISIEANYTSPSYTKSLMENLDQDEVKNYSRLLNYITRTQMRTLVHLQKVVKYNVNSYLKIDIASRRNLELVETLRFGTYQNTLFATLNKCSTAMGTRCLKRNITLPLIDKAEIEKRYDTIDLMKKAFIETSEVRKVLDDVYDLERIVGRISYENANPKDLLQLKKSLGAIPKLKKSIEKIKINNLYDLDSHYQDYNDLYHLIDASINEDAPYSIKDGGVIKAKYNDKLDELRSINKDSKSFLVGLENKERERTGIKQLKVGYNKVFGYYIEVSKLNSNLIKDEYGYIRKQTLVNAERYITQELKEKEAMILRALEESIALEHELFSEIRNKIKEYTLILQDLAKTIAMIDMMASFTKVANENKYTRPIISDGAIDIKDGRHPVVEKNCAFVANDLKMDEELVLLITGPNMSGKSTYMRQIALIAIMAQIGSFVPAKSARLPIFDQIFTRIGAADDIVSGQSTFMVEMAEVNNALKNATTKSLILFDEIGRGTATYDGIALAQAIVEYVHDKVKAKMLFSTHYHELTALESSLEHLKNVHVSAENVDGEIVFLHKVKDGAIDKSYGINVAKLAKIPLDVILRANDLLNKLQEQNRIDADKLSPYNYVAPLLYDSKTEVEKIVLNDLTNMNLYEMNPLDALIKLNELQKKLKG